MNGEIKRCVVCKEDFVIEQNDNAYYEKIGVQIPNNCPLCRARHRLAFRNERVFYRRACDRCGKEGVSMYSPNKPYTVWCYDCWFKDDWDATMYGKAYNPNRPFFEQLHELIKTVPRIALVHVRSVNSEYLNISADNKDCYMIVESSNNEGCTHCYWIQQCRDLIDVSFAHQTELSYESDDCYNSYKLFYSKGCHDSSESYFLLNCRDLKNCLACVNLRSKQYCIFNQQYTKEEYEKALRDMRLHSASGVMAMRKKFEEFALSQIHKYGEIVNAPGSTGNYIKDAKNCRECFHCYDAEDNRYGVHVWRNAKDCMDVDTAGRNAGMIYNSINAGLDVSHYICCNLCWSSSFMEYSTYCFNSNNCFGCVGLRKKDYCILNKQYTKEEYEKMTDNIRRSLKDAGVYGEYFPAELGTFGYNESAAFEQFPLLKEEALRLGFAWEDAERGVFNKETIKPETVPDSIRDVGEELKSAIFVCTNCRKNFRLIEREFQFYKKLDVPLPRLCPDCRHERRFKARGPNRLYKKRCACDPVAGKYKNAVSHFHGGDSCPNEFETAFSTNRPEIVYCESCYQNEVS